MKRVLFYMIFFAAVISINAQRDLTTHTRGKLWETLLNFGYIGSNGAWDYNEVTGVGFYPGFQGCLQILAQNQLIIYCIMLL